MIYTPWPASLPVGGGYQYTVAHEADANVARPSNPNPVIWVGSVEPVNAEDNDVWVNQ